MSDTANDIPTRPMNMAAHTAQTTTKVAAVFSLIFLILLVGNFVGTSILAPRRENRLIGMKTEIQGGQASDEQLAEIRQLDLRVRRDRIWRLDFARKASYALLAGVVVLLIAGKLTYTLSQQPPRPQPAPDISAEQIREARLSRWSVTGGLAALAAIVALLVIYEAPMAYVQAQEDQGPSYASMAEKREQWPRFRGPEGAGVSVFSNIPTQWDGATGQGIAWKTPVPLIGHNSPIVWKDRVFLSGATEEKREVYCFDAASGQLLWTGDVPTVPAVTQASLDIMEDTGYSACTMATDGYRAYVIFATGDIAAFDFNGRRLWHKNLGVPDSAYGYASSLETYRDRVIIQYDQGDGSEGTSRLYALDGATGRIVWEAKREVPNSWTSPILADVAGQPQIITVADPWVIAYDPNNGQEIWKAECVSGDVAPSPIYAGGLVMAIEPYSQMVAIKPTGQGVVTESHIAWRMEEGAPDICCPVGNDQYVFLLEGSGYLMCFDVTNGEMVYEHDLRDNFMASPSIAAGKLYLLSDEGTMYIAEIGPEYKEITKCTLDEKCHASPAFVDGRIYIRGIENLYCIGPAAAGDAQTEN